MIQQNSLVGYRLGQYQILEEIGSGGMATVYKAWQPSVQRYVAIKVLWPHLSTNSQFVQRFRQEAIIAAKLNHPNIVTVYEVNQSSGYLFIAMEYVEGQSLRDILAQEGPLPLERTIHILRQIAAALDYAHQNHIIHRDVKPANILITATDQAVVTDFGIAKALAGSGATAHLTATGTIIGTPAYMSPEQIQGLSIDHRSDLYSMGIICYEMLGGRPPFRGATTATAYAQVHSAPPPIREVNPSIPQHVEDALSRMLAKKPDNRFSTATAFVNALNAPDAAAPIVQHALPNHKPYSRFAQTKWVLTGGIALLGLLILLLSISLILQNGKRATIPAGTMPAKSSTGRIAFTSERDGNAEIYVIEVDGFKQVNLTNSSSADYWPQWSPDGSKIAFHSYKSSESKNAEIFVMNSEGENWIRLTNHKAADKFPGWSSDGQRIVFASDRDGNFEIYTMDSDGTHLTRVTHNSAKDYFPTWVPNEDKILFSSDRAGNSDIYLINADGSGLTRLTDDPAEDTLPACSPTGRIVAFTSDRSGQREIWIMDIDGSNPSQLTFEGGWQPRWSPDGSKIAFVSKRDGDMEIYVMNSDGTNPTRLTESVGRDWDPHWSK